MEALLTLVTLLNRRDSRSLSEPRSERKKGIHTSLTALTEAALCIHSAEL